MSYREKLILEEFLLDILKGFDYPENINDYMKKVIKLYLGLPLEEENRGTTIVVTRNRESERRRELLSRIPDSNSNW